MKRFEMIFSAILIVVAAAVISVSQSFPEAGSYDVGAGFFPKAAAGILIFLSGLQIVLSLLAKSEESSQKTDYKWVWMSMGLLFLYIISVNYLLGFSISTILYLAGQLWIFKIRKPVMLALISLGVTGVIYYSFVILLNVPLPDYF